MHTTASSGIHFSVATVISHSATLSEIYINGCLVHVDNVGPKAIEGTAHALSLETRRRV